jgi:putative membrane protein
MKLIASLALVLFMACPGAASAQISLNEQDVQFLEQMAQSGMLEVQASQLALQSATEEGVKQYAQLMLIEHEKIADSLQGLASAYNIELPSELQGKFRDTLASLQQQRSAEFDQRFIDDVAIGAHEDAVKLFKRVAEETQNQDINTFAKKSMTVLLQHLDRAKNISQSRKSNRSSNGDANRDASGDTDAIRTKQATPSNALPSSQPKPQGTQPTMEGEPGTPEKAAEMQ